MRTTTALLATLTVALLAGVPVQATVVSGQVTNTVGGAGIANVDLDFIDRDTGTSIPLVNDDTDFLGFYAVSVPAGDYDVRFKPPAGVPIVAEEERNVRVEGAVMTMNRPLVPGWFVSGTVLDSNSIPVNPLDLDVVDVIAGNPMYVANDNTDIGGNFSIVLPTGQFDIEFEPIVGSLLVPLRLTALDVTANTPLGNVVMALGVRLSGTVRDSLLLPVGQVQVQTIDPATGAEIFNIRNTTAVDGRFELVVEQGSLDLQLIPSRGSILLPRYLGGVQLAADLILPDIVLDDGVLITGTVLAPGGGAAGTVDLDFVSAWTGDTRFTPRDNTDDTGSFAIAVPPGSYEVRYDPPPPTGWGPAQLLGQVLATSTTLPTVQLQNGVVVSGAVRDGVGTPQAGLDLDFLLFAGTQEAPSSQDTTDVAGNFAATVNPGSYDLRVNPLPGSGLSQALVAGVNANSAVNVGTIVLPVSTTPTVTSVTPANGPSHGGTLVTVGGTGFIPGASVKIGAAELIDVVVLGGTTLQGTTAAHPAGAVSVDLVNPGAAPVTATQTFVFTIPAQDPFLTLDKAGPLRTDLLLQWTSTGRPFYTVFRSTAPQPSTMSPLDATAGLTLRTDAAASPTAPPLLFFLVE